MSLLPLNGELHEGGGGGEKGGRGGRGRGAVLHDNSCIWNSVFAATHCDELVSLTGSQRMSGSKEIMKQG